MKRLLALSIFVLVGLLLVSNSTVVRADMPVPTKPENNSYVRDETNTLSNVQTQALNEKIQGYRDRTGNQLAVLIIPTITNDYLENFSINVARTWGVGEAGKNNGALLLVVKNDRQLRIEVGSGLEGSLTDLRASRIIRDRITPDFRQGKYYQGINAGLDGISLAIGNAPDPQLKKDTSTKSSWVDGLGVFIELAIYIGFFGITWLGSILGRSERWWPGGVIGGVTGVGSGYLISQGTWLIALISMVALGAIGLSFDYIVSKNYHKARKSGRKPSWWAGGTTFGSGSSGDSGGFGGFGGGGFSGGGSSGSW